MDEHVFRSMVKCFVTPASFSTLVLAITELFLIRICLFVLPEGDIWSCEICIEWVNTFCVELWVKRERGKKKF